ncbi:MAG: hypothetical protein JOZ54_20680 [Acidobacteria bacterium]|nr:hypothetical protein [Acidobacteriota bacterium]
MKLAVSSLALLLAALGGTSYRLVRENRDLRRQTAAAAIAQQGKNEREQSAARLAGQCQPFYEPMKDARPLNVAVYFSLDRDCLSCVQDVVEQLNGAIAAGLPIAVTGYTTVDGVQDERILEEKMKPAFPVKRLDRIEEKLRAAGVTSTPIVFVTNPATGRVLLAHAPEKKDRSFVDRIRLLATPCS